MRIATVPDLARVVGWFESGALIRPRESGRADLVDLVHAVAGICGVDRLDHLDQRRVAPLRATIGEHDHVVFVLIDGLGHALLRHLNAATGAGFLAAHEAQALEAVFPSTTAAVLTSMATGTHPSQHGVPGWWTYFAELGVAAETLPFVERFTKRPMLELGASVAEAFAEPSLMPRFRHRPLVVTRDYIAGSTYSTWWAGGCDSVAYDRFADGVDRVLARVATADAPTYTYLYLNQLDGICHQRGIDHVDTNATFAAIDHELERLHAGLAGRARLIATADHGHVNAADDCVLAHDHPLIAHLVAPPSGEARTPVFHVRPGHTDDFRALFADELGEWFALLSIDDVDDLRLLGPGPLTARARRRFGDFLGVAVHPHTVTYVPAGAAVHRNRGVHAGLTSDEMLVPLILG